MKSLVNCVKTIKSNQISINYQSLVLKLKVYKTNRNIKKKYK